MAQGETSFRLFESHHPAFRVSDRFRSLLPQLGAKNPVMFVVEVGSV